MKINSIISICFLDCVAPKVNDGGQQTSIQTCLHNEIVPGTDHSTNGVPYLGPSQDRPLRIRTSEQQMNRHSIPLLCHLSKYT